MSGILLLGFLVGMQHAFEADHVAAVSSVIAGDRSIGGAVRHGLGWGLGHALVLGGVAGAAIGLGTGLSDWWSHFFEMAVGLMLAGLGARVLYRLARERIGWRLHRHSDGTLHFHAVTPASERRGEHGHRRGLPPRALLIGMAHGLAGSGAVLVLAVAGVRETWAAIGYVALFGAGSILGMVALSAIVAVPLAWSARSLVWGNVALQAVVGLASTVIGLQLAVSSASALG